MNPPKTPKTKPVMAWCIAIDGSIMPLFCAKEKKVAITKAEAIWLHEWTALKRRGFRAIKVKITAL